MESYLDELKRLPLPTSNQLTCFAKHLSGVHSWYKHLPLDAGGHFVVFLAEDAGEDYPLEHPSLPFGNSAGGYRQAFGHLDYAWSISSTPCHQEWVRDNRRLLPKIPIDLHQSCQFVLYPYVVSNEELIGFGVHESALNALSAGARHPDRDLILSWRKLHLEMEELWSALSEEDIAHYWRVQEAAAVRHAASNTECVEPAARSGQRYLRLEYDLSCIMATLAKKEAGKIDGALAQLLQWIDLNI